MAGADRGTVQKENSVSGGPVGVSLSSVCNPRDILAVREGKKGAQGHGGRERLWTSNHV